MAAEVDIVLPTYNGERYLEAQLQSLLVQTHRDSRILIRDDGSTDGTVALIERIARRDGRISLLRDDRGRLAAMHNVSALIDASSAPFIFLCDQDDVWHPRKVELELQALRGVDGPGLVFSDLEVVSESLEPLSPSFMSLRSLDPHRGTTFGRLLIRNLLVGCTMAMNRALVRLVTPVPANAYMHDWWIALVAAAFGDIRYVPQPLVRYRQHGANVMGAGVGLLEDALRMAASPGRILRYYRKTRAQAQQFRARFGERVEGDARRALDAYLDARRPFRAAQLAAAGIRDSSTLRNVALYSVG